MANWCKISRMIHLIQVAETQLEAEPKDLQVALFPQLPVFSMQPVMGSVWHRGTTKLQNESQCEHYLHPAERACVHV